MQIGLIFILRYISIISRQGGKTLTMSGVAVLQINNFDRQIKNDFKALCAKNGYTLKQGILLMMQTAIGNQSLDCTKPRKKT